MKVKVACLQICPGQRASWKDNLDRAVRAAESCKKQGADLLLLPELFCHGPLQGLEALKRAASNEEAIIEGLKAASKENNMVIAGGLATQRAKDRFYNTMVVIEPGGRTSCYHKLHLFPLFKEPELFQPGNSPITVSCQLNRGHAVLGPMICYDIRFPELARRLSTLGAQVLLVSSLWPMSRRENFLTLLRARALENQCFLLAANGCGTCEDITFAGSSLVVAPNGTVISMANHQEQLLVAEIDLSKIKSLRSSFNSSWPQGHWNFPTDEKILPLKELLPRVAARRAAGQRMVFTNGCFDLLHAGHVSYLKKARTHGDFLVVGLNSDESVSRIKGNSRPINPQDQRAKVLAALSFVDYVTIFQEDTPGDLINHLQPDVLVKGADWQESEIVGADLVKARGGKVIRIRFDIPTSTTNIISSIIKGHCQGQ